MTQLQERSVRSLNVRPISREEKREEADDARAAIEDRIYLRALEVARKEVDTHRFFHAFDYVEAHYRINKLQGNLVEADLRFDVIMEMLCEVLGENQELQELLEKYQAVVPMLLRRDTLLCEIEALETK